MIEPPYSKYTYEASSSMFRTTVSIHMTDKDKCRATVLFDGKYTGKACSDFENGLDWCEKYLKDIASFDGEITFFPTDVDSHYRLMVSERDRQLKQAKEILTKIADSNPAGPDATTCVFCNNWIAKHSEDCPYLQSRDFKS